MKEVIRNIGAVRSEMRYYRGKEIPNFSEEVAKKAVERLESNISLFKRRIRFSEEDSLGQLKIMRELSKLMTDIEAFGLTKMKGDKKSSTDIKRIPVLNPIDQLSNLLGAKPLHTN